MNRDLNDPKYKLWRNRVYRRDGYKCMLCGCKKGLQAHHIVRWADCEKLRYVVKNGITLCSIEGGGNGCHEMITGFEKQWEERLRRLIAPVVNDQILKVKALLRRR